MKYLNPYLLKRAGAAQAAVKGIKALAAAAKKGSVAVKAWQNSGEGLIRIKNAINTPQAMQAIKRGLRGTDNGWIKLQQILDAPLERISPYRQNRMLRQLYGGSTFLPKEPVFLKKNTKALLEAAKKEGFGNYKVSGKYERPGDVIRFTDKNLLTGKERSYDIPYNAQAFYTTSDSLFDQLLDHSGLTNKQVINRQAGDLNYWHQMKKHLSGISKADQIRAGIWIAPEANRAAFGERAALTPTIKNVLQGYSNAYYDAAENKIEVIRALMEDAKSSPNTYNIFTGNGTTYSVGDNSKAGLAAMVSHELNHSNGFPKMQVKVHNKFNKLNPRAEEYTYAVNGDTLYSPIFHANWVEGGMNGMNDNPEVAANIPHEWFDASYNFKPEFRLSQLGVNKLPANPIMRRFALLPPNTAYQGYNGALKTGEAGPFAYAYNHHEMIQGLISLNRAQSLLQHAIRRNPQLYINAGFDPRAINKFLRLPRFLKSPAMLDQRMEFYLNHPEFMHILGEEPSRIIPRYFMLERERFNPVNGQEWRDLHQDMFDFMRSNYFLASAVPPVAAAPVVYGQMMDNDPGNTGMGRYMSNTAIA